MHDIDINLKNISKIEGHTNLSVQIKEGKVINCKLEINENKRFFVQAVLGSHYKDIPHTLSRICGTCSAAHLLASIKAVEDALNITPTEQTKKLRELVMLGNHIRDHAMHLYFFVLPDVFKKDSVLDFNKEEHEWVHEGLDVKGAGNSLSINIGGRAVHPPNANVGGFTKYPTKEEIEETITKLKKARTHIKKLAELFMNNRWKLERNTKHLALTNKDNYSFTQGNMKTNEGETIPKEEFKEHLEKFILPYATADAFTQDMKEYYVGSLARLNLNKEQLHKKTKEELKEILKEFPSNNIFDNSLAQTIELMHMIDTSTELLEKPIIKEELQEINIKEGEGIGVVEAPRGTLYHHIKINNEGTVTQCDLCIPTQQNLFHIENSITQHVQENINKTKEEIEREIEKVIRAYDPCMSCAANFLKVKWEEE